MLFNKHLYKYNINKTKSNKNNAVHSCLRTTVQRARENRRPMVLTKARVQMAFKVY